MNTGDEIKTNNKATTSTRYNRYLIWCMLFISIGYQYKLFFCGGLGLMLGFKSICYTVVHGITTNHWFEHIVYVPFMWIALNHINNVVFSSLPIEKADKGQQYKKWIGQFLCAIYIYGYGIHMTNTLEIMARNQDLATGLLYDQIWWLDEQISHQVQFCSFFLLLCWFILHDQPDRSHNKYIAIITGIIHGVDRGIGVIEGDNPSLAFWLVGLVSVACFYRWQKHNKEINRAWKDFFFRHGVGFVFTICILLTTYDLLFGLDNQPSEMGMGALKVIALGITIIIIEIIIILGVDKISKSPQ